MNRVNTGCTKLHFSHGSPPGILCLCPTKWTCLVYHAQISIASHLDFDIKRVFGIFQFGWRLQENRRTHSKRFPLSKENEDNQDEREKGTDMNTI